MRRFIARIRLARRGMSKLWRDLFPESSSYKPERHFMRGPGPRYQAKHGTPALNGK